MIDEFLKGNAAGLALLEKVRKFYGRGLIVRTHAAGTDANSRFWFDTGDQRQQFREAGIDIAIGGDRETAAAVHELLHLSLPLRQFPVFCALRPSQDLIPVQFDTVHEIVKKTINVMQHDVFVGDFVATGLPLIGFLGRRTQFASYRDQSQRAGRGKEWEEWSWWGFEYLNNRISIAHGDPSAPTFAKDAIKWGERRNPGFKAQAARIDAQLSTGAHRCADSYAGAVQAIIDLYRLPVDVVFCTLRARDGDVPQVISV